MTVVTRFAPSPTGHLHIGGARTALFSWLYAKHHNGKFILRIEDTDRERSTQEALDAIIESMTWLGLDWDEGPYYQTKRTARYHEVLQALLKSGHAYRCHCSKERLTTLREQQMARKEKARYDGHCRDKTISEHEPHVIRFLNPDAGNVIIQDKVRGDITISNTELDDLIIARTDGTPTYNFTVVVDDADMGVTHVIRGDDHINNTPRQINIFHAMGVTIPTYAHVPMILGPDGKRYSKRHGATSVMEFEKEGYLPEALLNYLVRLGWSHGDQEIFSLTDMIEKFSLSALNNSPAAVNPEKLLWLNQHYLKAKPINEMANLVTQQFKEVDLEKGPTLTDVIAEQLERCKTVKEIAEKSAFFYTDISEYDPVAASKNLTAETKPVLEHLIQAFNQTTDWQKESLHQVIKDTATSLDLKMGKVAQPIRVAVTGGTVSPSIDVTLQLLGKEKTLARLAAAIDFIAA